MPGAPRGADGKTLFFMSMSRQTNTPQNLHGNFTHRFSLAGRVGWRDELRIVEVCVGQPCRGPVNCSWS
jgi:hypothetical protein